MDKCHTGTNGYRNICMGLGRLVQTFGRKRGYSMTKIACPHGLQAIIDAYGDPDRNNDFILDDEWYENKTKVFQLPFPMRLSWNKVSVQRMRAHTFVGDAMVDALDEIGKRVGIEKLQELEWDMFDGCFCFRPKRGQSELSVHSWGVALDINPHLGPMGEPSRQPDVIVKAFKDRGFEWGGDWKVPDGMHLQACTGY